MKLTIRKGCSSCGAKLITFKEKVSRNCEACAQKALEGFSKMSQGKIKEGFTQVLAVKGLSKKQGLAVKGTVKTVMSKRKKKLYKALKKKGLSQEEIEEGLRRFGELGV